MCIVDRYARVCLSRGINRDKFPDLRNRQPRASRKIVSQPISDYFNNPVPNGTEPLLQIHTRQNDTSPPPPRGFGVHHPSTHEKAKIIRSLSTLTGMQLSSGCGDPPITLPLRTVATLRLHNGEKMREETRGRPPRSPAFIYRFTIK